MARPSGTGSCGFAIEPVFVVSTKGFDPARTNDILMAFRDLVIACVEWGEASDECLLHYPVAELDRAIELLDPIFGTQS